MYGHTLFPAYQFECIAVIDITFSTFRHRAPVVELDLEFQANEGCHAFATVMNTIHFTIHVV